MKIIYIYLFLATVLFSCVNKNESERKTPFKEIDLNKQTDLIKLSEIFDSVSVTPLETKPECLIAEINSLFVGESKIYILDKMKESILVFSKDGKFIGKICNPGKGSGEYLNIYDFFIDIKKEQIVLITSNKIQFYSSNNLKLIKEIPKDIFGIQYWYLGKGIFAAYQGNMGSEYNLLFFRNNRIISRQLKIDSKLKEYNFAPENNFSLKNDCNDTYFSLPFENVIYQINGTDLVEKIQLDYSRNNIPEKIWKNYEKEKLTQRILSKGYCYGKEDFFTGKDFNFFKFRAEKKVFHCFYNQKSKIIFSNVVVDDLSGLPFHRFQFGSIKNNFLATSGDVVDLFELYNIMEQVSVAQKEIILERIPIQIKHLHRTSNINSNPFIICYHY